MTKHLIAIGIAVLLICVGLSGCTEIEGEIDIKESIKGQWGAYQSETSYVFTFYDDGTCKYSFGLYIMGKYYVVGDRLECHFEDVALVGDFQNFYDIEMPDDDTLILTTKGSGELTHDGRLEYSRLN